MRRWLGENLTLIIMSILLAFFFWIVAIEAENPTQKSIFRDPIPIAVLGLPDTMIAYDQDATEVKVELLAPQAVWEKLDKNSISAHIDLSDIIVTGTVAIPVEVVINAEPVRQISVSPAMVTLKVEPLLQRTLSVSLKIEGDVALGYKMESPVIEPLAVTLKGAQSFVEQAATVQTHISIDTRQTALRRRSTLSAYDLEGQIIDNVDILPNDVSVHIPVSPLGQIRDLAINPAIEGQPASGYNIVDIKTLPQIAKVYGPPSLVRDAPGFLQTQLINIAGITQSLTTTVAMQAPAWMSILEPSTPDVTVVLHIEAIKSSLNLDIVPTLTGLHSAFTATVGIEAVVVILNGPLEIMDTLPFTAVHLMLDLTNLTPGDYNLAPVVSVPSRVTIQNLLPEAVPVKITKIEIPQDVPRIPVANVRP